MPFSNCCFWKAGQGVNQFVSRCRLDHSRSRLKGSDEVIEWEMDDLTTRVSAVSVKDQQYYPMSSGTAVTLGLKKEIHPAIAKAVVGEFTDQRYIIEFAEDGIFYRKPLPSLGTPSLSIDGTLYDEARRFAASAWRNFDPKESFTTAISENLATWSPPREHAKLKNAVGDQQPTGNLKNDIDHDGKLLSALAKRGVSVGLCQKVGKELARLRNSTSDFTLFPKLTMAQERRVTEHAKKRP